MPDQHLSRKKADRGPVVHAGISHELDAELEAVCMERGLNRSDVVRDALRHYFSTRKEAGDER